MKNSNDYVYRIFSLLEFEIFKKKKKFYGNKLDLKSGFIHLSKKGQLKETLKRYFKNDRDLVIAEFRVDKLSKSLRWEVSRNNEVFPHLFSELEYNWLNKVYKKDYVHDI